MAGFISPKYTLSGELRLKRPLKVLFQYGLLITSTIVLFSCSYFFLPGIDLKEGSKLRVGDPGLDNMEYAALLSADGWPADTLNTAVSADFLDDDEKNLVLAHNLVRYDPAKFARLYVTEYISYFKGKEFHYPDIEPILLTMEGKEPAVELFYELLRWEGAGLLVPSEGLSEAAASHARYICELGIRGHGGQGGMRARIERYGTWERKIAENISYGNFSAHDAIMYMLIDDQVFERSHRKIIMDPDFVYIGVAKDLHPRYPTGYTYVINYARMFREYPDDNE